MCAVIFVILCLFTELCLPFSEIWTTVSHGEEEKHESAAR